MNILGLHRFFKIYCLIFLLAFSLGYSQIGLGTASPNPNAILDLNSSDKAFLMPRLDNVSKIVSPEEGMMVYDKSLNCVRVYQDGNWGDCFQASLLQAVGSFRGSFCSSFDLSGSSFVVRLINNNVYHPINFKPKMTDVKISGVPNVEVVDVFPNVVTAINPGAFLDVIYSLAGVLPANNGTINAVFERQKMSLSVVKVIKPLPTVVNSVVTEIFDKKELKSITIATTNATSIGVPTGLPPGVNANFFNNEILISGIATKSGTFNYSIPVYGCDNSGLVKAEGKIFVYPDCYAYMGATEIREFLCHNLGADTTLDPHIPNLELIGAYIQWGKKGPGSNAVIDWITAPTDATIGFAAAPKAGNLGWTTVVSFLGSSPGPVGSWGVPKTSNDPCPEGFRVPTEAEFIALRDNNIIVNSRPWLSDGSGPQIFSSLSTLYTVLDKNSYKPILSFPPGGIYSNSGHGSFGEFARIHAISTTSGSLMIDFSRSNPSGIPRLAGSVGSNAINVRCIAE